MQTKLLSFDLKSTADVILEQRFPEWTDSRESVAGPFQPLQGQLSKSVRVSPIDPRGKLRRVFRCKPR